MKVKFWLETNLVGSTIERTVDLNEWVQEQINCGWEELE